MSQNRHFPTTTVNPSFEFNDDLEIGHTQKRKKLVTHLPVEWAFSNKTTLL